MADGVYGRPHWRQRSSPSALRPSHPLHRRHDGDFIAFDLLVRTTPRSTSTTSSVMAFLPLFSEKGTNLHPPSWPLHNGSQPSERHPTATAEHRQRERSGLPERNGGNTHRGHVQDAHNPRATSAPAYASPERRRLPHRPAHRVPRDPELSGNSARSALSPASRSASVHNSGISGRDPHRRRQPPPPPPAMRTGLRLHRSTSMRRSRARWREAPRPESEPLDVLSCGDGLAAHVWLAQTPVDRRAHRLGE